MAVSDTRRRRRARPAARRSRSSTRQPAPLVAAARAARRHAVAEYSGFRVGAALELRGGGIVTGCNVENASYGLTMCAERVALLKALSDGHRAFRRLVIVSAAAEPTPPCGACRQLLWELAGDLEVIAVTLGGRRARWRLRALLPKPFDRRQLGRDPL